MSHPSIRICLWSGPRNVSTALLYSFAQRSDTEVLDEPLYAHFLRVSGAQHPLREAALAAQSTDGEQVVKDVILGPSTAPVLFCKQMAHHLVDLDLAFLRQTRNVLLTRDPEEMLPSLQSRIGNPCLRDTGLARQCDVLDLLRRWGQDPVVLDARELLLDPPGVLRQLCDSLALPYEKAMLKWPPGSKPFDGAWAAHWYRNVHRSTGFRPYVPKQDPFPRPLEPLLDKCLPYYRRLRQHALLARETEAA